MGTGVDMMRGFNNTGPMPFVTGMSNNDQNNKDENMGCFSEGIQRPHFGTGCSEQVGGGTQEFFEHAVFVAGRRSREEGMKTN